MSDMKFDVVFNGTLVAGADPEAVKEHLQRLAGVSEKAAEAVLASPRAVLKKQADAETAQKYADILIQAGMAVALEPVVTEAAGETGETGEDAEHNGGGGDGNGGYAKRYADPVAPKNIPITFHGTGGEYFRIWIVNMILSVLTFGIYSAWAKVRRKQYFYGNTRIDGAAFSYHAEAKKILVGRIVVLTFFVISSLISEVQPVAGIAVTLGFVLLMPWMLVRSFTFNAKNTAYRNIRFGFHGSVWDAAKVFVLLPVLVPFTLGGIFPYVLFRQQKFFVENSSYGKSRFYFLAKPGAYYRMYMGLIPPVLLGIVCAAGLAFLLPGLVILPMAAMYLYCFSWFSVKTTNLLYNASRVGNHRLEAHLEVLPYTMIVATNSVGTALSLGMFYPWAKVRALQYKLEHMGLLVAGDLDSFVAEEEQSRDSVIGEEAADFFDFEFGL